ncbi:hypothetical protein QOZ80_8BG0668490 [Eleusine coracana subsp. coracana]|nr:hypothetical protein QOZ80_8BG0668490 [Eleusine coracana subsp. coracana]
MDGSCKGTGGGAADNSIPDQNPSPNNPPPAATGDDDAAHAAAAEGRRPFTSLSQEEADLALARVLQEQERAYMMLTGQGGGEYAMLDAEGYDYEDDDYEEEDVSDYEEEEGEGEDEEVGDAEGDEVDLDLDPARYADDEAFARALQDAEERDVAGRLMALAGFGDWRTTMGQDDDDEDDEEGDGDPQDAWEDVDPDEYSYEELVALGEVVGTESKGLSAETIASLPTVTYQAQDKQDGNMEQCVICRVEFDEGESLVALPCKHSYHSECINHWLQLNKVCPMCSAEVATSVNKQDIKPDFNNGKK